jgi:hypothetical protein
MTVDPYIYVHRPELIGLSEDKVDFADLQEALHEAASGATEISVLGGFYSVKGLVELCRQVPRADRKDCLVRIAVGLEATALIPRTWDDMRDLGRQLRKLGFRDATVAVVPNAPVHFHTKLFRILRRTRPVWFIGSANPGSDRHELMVRIAGRHEALSGYVDAVFQKALPVTSATPPRTEIRTLRDFFLTGMLCHKPPVQRLFTFDAFRFTPENRDDLARVLAGEAGVEHARPRTEGFGFSLRSALNEPEVKGSKRAVSQRIHYRRSCLDTVLGFWTPRFYAREIEAQIAKEDRQRLRRLETLAESLASPAGQQAAQDGFADHVSSMERFLSEHKIDAQPVQNRDESFAKFLASRTKTLRKPEMRERLARSMTLTDMPDIWEDAKATEAFEASFFEDLAFRIGSPGAGRVIRSLAEALDHDGTETPEELREALASRVESDAWTDEDWYE